MFDSLNHTQRTVSMHLTCLLTPCTLEQKGVICCREPEACFTLCWCAEQAAHSREDAGFVRSLYHHPRDHHWYAACLVSSIHTFGMNMVSLSFDVFPQNAYLSVPQQALSWKFDAMDCLLRGPFMPGWFAVTDRGRI